MRKTFWERWIAGIIVLLSAVSLVSAQANPSLKDILRKNLEASGGKAKLAQVKNLSFKTGGVRNFVSAAGEFKAVTGKDPVITEVLSVMGEKVLRNSFDNISEITGSQKTVYQMLAKLYAGVFSLAKFGGQLKLEGEKSFGPEKLYHLTTKVQAGSVTTHFYLRTDDFSLKRLVFQGKTADGDKYEANYDFGPLEEVDGIRLPLSWFVSEVGTRGNLVEVSEVKANQPLRKGFFAGLKINAGKTEAAPGEMKGNIIDFSSSPFGLTIVTNWMKKEAEKAGLQTGNKLALLIEGEEYEVTFFAMANEVPPPNELPKGARILSPSLRGGETMSIQFFGSDNGALSGKLKPLTVISIKRISSLREDSCYE